MRQFFLILIVGLLLASPLFVSAQITGPLVPCDGAAGKDAKGNPLKECQVCHAVELGQNIINFFVAAAAFIAVAIFAYAGFLMLTAAGDTGKISTARGMFTNVVVGLVIVLAGWLIIDTVMKWAFQGTTEGEEGSPLYEAAKEWGFGPWNEIKCAVLAPYKPSTSGMGQPGGTGVGVVPGPGPGSTPAPSAGCSTCQTIDTSIVACKSAASCTIDAGYAAQLYTLAQAQDIPKLTVTEAYPPTREHQNQCHYDGTCTDIAFSDRNFTTERIQAFAAAARAAGLRAVYEPTAGSVCPSGVECLPYATTRSTGNHFSLYDI